MRSVHRIEEKPSIHQTDQSTLCLYLFCKCNTLLFKDISPLHLVFGLNQNQRNRFSLHQAGGDNVDVDVDVGRDGG